MKYYLLIILFTLLSCAELPQENNLEIKTYHIDEMLNSGFSSYNLRVDEIILINNDIITIMISTFNLV